MARIRKLSDDAVRHIRTASVQPKKLAEAYDVSTQLIYDIKKHRRYADVADQPELAITFTDNAPLQDEPTEVLRDGQWVPFQEYPKMLYNEQGAWKIVQSAEEERQAGNEWKRHQEINRT